MERLTKKGVSALGIYKTCCVNFRNAECECFGGDCTKCSTNEKVWDRLAAYEDTGLTPDKVEAQQQEIDDLKRRISQRDAMNLNQKNLINGLIREKDEQAGMIMRMDTGLKDIKFLVECCECACRVDDECPRCQALTTIDALLGGKEDEN